MAAIAAGVSMRRYASTLEELPPPEQALSVSKSATSRRFVALSEEQLLQWLSRSLGNASFGCNCPVSMASFSCCFIW